MSALAFLVRKQFINFFRDLFHHPGKLITYIFSVAVILFALLVPGTKAAKPTSQATDIRILHGIYLGILLLLSVPSLFSALKSGTTMFKMSDVNFLFVSPLSPKHILNYGLLKQMTTTLTMFLFVLCYSGTLMELFRIGPSGVVILIIGLAATLFFVQVLSLLIYSYANGNPKRKGQVRSVLILFFGLMALTFLYVFRQNGSGVEGLLAALGSRQLEYFPVIGWAKGFTFALLGGQTFYVLLYAALFVGLLAVALTVFERSDPDYYEDVLGNTEKMFEVTQAAKGRNTMQMRPSNRKVHVGKTGIEKGWGADTFFYKHLCEARRRSRLPFLGGSTIMTLFADLALWFIITSSTKNSSDAISTDLLLVILTGVNLYILFLQDAMGDWSRELAKPYIYLVPEKPFKKLLWASMTTIVRPVVDGVIYFAVLAFAMQTNPLSALGCFLAYASFGLLFLAGNVLSARTMGSLSNRGLIAMIYMFLLIVLMAPGIGGAVFLYGRVQAFAGALFLAMLPVAVWNLLISFVILYLCRNLLDTTDVVS